MYCTSLPLRGAIGGGTFTVAGGHAQIHGFEGAEVIGDKPTRPMKPPAFGWPLRLMRAARSTSICR